jgi:hypothetical protein
MKKHHTKTKGDLGVLKVQCDLFQKGYLILSPQTEHESFDLVTYKDGEFDRIQVKYRALKDGKLQVQFKSYWSDKSGNHIKNWEKDSIDIVAVYCPDTDECYYFDPDDFNKSVVLRVEATKNNQVTNIHLASDYLEMPY